VIETISMRAVLPMKGVDENTNFSLPKGLMQYPANSQFPKHIKSDA
jgi:hypothetical protein